VDETSEVLGPDSENAVLPDLGVDNSGQYVWNVRTGWGVWSDAVYRIHGYEPGTVVPSLELVLQHKHPEDRGLAEGIIERSLATGRPYSYCHRIIDTRGRLHWVIVVGSCVRDADTSEVVQLRGYVADITRSQERAASTAVMSASLNSAAIEQAKGALMIVYGIDAEAAFQLLCWYSQNHNVKLARLAAHLLTTISHHDVGSPMRGAMDKLLFDVAHELQGPRAQPRAT
jgi:PAS domain S-box-containing protein